jgi:GNAT superfamily N-acetyltransferase
MCEGNVAVVIRQLTDGDAEAAARLCGQLGYPTTAATLRQRLRERNDESVLFAACVNGELVGWLNMAIRWSLDSGRYGEIVGLVVSDAHRSQGVGAKLVAHGEEWLRSFGVENVVVRSRVQREAAHRFYRREGYTDLKQQIVFEKKIR